MSAKPEVFSADDLVRVFGDQAYHKGLRLVIEALAVGDQESCRKLSEAVRELMMRGYHKLPERV